MAIHGTLSPAPTGEVTPKQLNSINEFIAKVLKSGDFKVLPLAGDASTRKYFRVVNDDKSWVLMLWDPFNDIENYPFLNIRQHFAKAGVDVPKMIDLKPEDGLVLLEDLGDLTLERKFWETQDQSISLPFYIQAIDELIKIHYNATNDHDENCTAFNVKFDTDKFMWEMNYAKTHLIEGLAEVKISAAMAKRLESDFLKICKILDRQPKRISHRDYHSRNLMIKLDRVCVIDFQDARMGPVQYDLASLFHDSYVDMPKDMQNKLLQYYFERAEGEFDQKFDRDEFHQIMLIQTVQRCFKACGTFSSKLNASDDRRYLHYIHPTLSTVVETLETLGEFSNLKSIIVDEGLMEIDYEGL
ncbi:MAG: phosphotransferase [Bdellovibrionales bacterium]